MLHVSTAGHPAAVIELKHLDLLIALLGLDPAQKQAICQFAQLPVPYAVTAMSGYTAGSLVLDSPQVQCPCFFVPTNSPYQPTSVNGRSGSSFGVSRKHCGVPS
eukprot:GHUV01028082.1.p4 GENE.GHUV01028082.1~~GHUV01028082.1.p4  ORF type:complete len:104 (+),score=20.80 GHUV01028082.1:947-1258(+)